jgi:hypothetical protein
MIARLPSAAAEIDTPHVEEAAQFVIGGVLRDFF